MPSLHPRRADAPGLARFRELFPGSWRFTPGLIERILEAGKTAENLPLPTELRTAASYRSTATQTEWSEEVRRPSSRAPKEERVATCSYAFSSTQVDLLDVEENKPLNSTQLPVPDCLSQKASPAIDATWLSPYAPFIFGKGCKQSEEIQSPRVILASSLRDTNGAQSLSSQDIPDKSDGHPKKIVLAQRQTYRVDDKTGTIFLSKKIKLSWKNTFVTVRLPPERFQGPMLHNTGPGKQERKLNQPVGVAYGIVRERTVPQDIEDAGDDESDEGSDNDRRADSNVTGFKTFNPAIYKGSVFNF